VSGDGTRGRGPGVVSPDQTLAAARAAGAKGVDLSLPEVAVLTFSESVLARLAERCGLANVPWLDARVHPYAAVEVTRRGSCEGLDVIVLVPPMGASPMACTIEDLVACGVRVVFLVCAAWSLGPPLRFGEFVVPSFVVGPDGTSIHYGNDEGYVEADAAVISALADAGRGHGAVVHVGGNASCEALYRITPEAIASFRSRGCLTMENGEAATLSSVCRSLGALGGALFQPYLDLTRGWEPSRLDVAYRETGRLQADVVLEAALRLRRDRVI